MAALLQALFGSALMLPCLAQRSATIDTINATYGATPAPFNIDVDPAFIEETQQKVATFRYTRDDLGFPAFSDGPPLSDARWFHDAWVNSYNWTQVQAELNSL